MPKVPSNYRRNVLTLVTGTTIAQVIPLIASPILTRLYSPEDFGFYAYYSSASIVLSVMSTGKYEMAITLPEKDEEARILVQLSILIAVIFSLFLGLFILVLSGELGAWLGIDDTRFLGILPFATLLIGVNQSLYYYANRMERYKYMATGRAVRSFVYSLGSVLAGFWRPGGIAMILSDLGGLTASSRVLFDKRLKLLRLSDIGAIKENARRYINFPKFSIFAGFLEKMAGQAPVFLLTKLFLSSGIIGFFALAQRTIIAPSDLITRAISDVFRQQASQAYASRGRCDDVFRAALRKLVFIGIIVFPLGYFIIEDAFSFVFGEEWREAGIYAQIMFPMFFLQFIVSPLSIMFVIAQKQRYDLGMQVLLVILVFVALYGGYKLTGKVETCLHLFTAVYCVKYTVELYFSYRFSKGSND